MKIKALILGAAIAAFPMQIAQANDRYSTPPAVQLSPDLSSPWLLQLKQPQTNDKKARVGLAEPKPKKAGSRTIRWFSTGQAKKKRAVKRRTIRTGIFQPLNFGKKKKKKASYQRISTRPVQRNISPAERPLDPKWLPQNVSYQTSQKPGTIIIDTNTRFLYLVLEDGRARRYGVGVGKQGFEWSGTERITRKAEWPSWTPPREMIERERKKGRELPPFMEGGPANPMGARALYLGSTLYRIHGTNQPWTIGQAVSSGCIRMRNEDVIDLYERAKRGAKVIVS